MKLFFQDPAGGGSAAPALDPSGGSRMLLAVGLFLLNILFFSLALSTLLFMVGVSVTPLHLPAAILAAVVFSAAVQRLSWRSIAAMTALGLAILVLCLLLTGYVDDWSWDGNSYHKGIAGALCWGWNPLRESFYQFAKPYEFLSHCVHTWYDAYPKAAELFSACVHALTGNIETGKSFNLLAMAAVFFLGWGTLLGTGLFKGWQAFFCAGLAVANPVSLSQVFTFYNDGFLGNMLLLCLIGLLCLTFCPERRTRALAGYFVFVSIQIGFNLKFSALLFFAVLCLTFFGYWTVGACRAQGLSGGVQAVRGRFCLLAASVISGLLVMGSTSYVTNTIRYHNPVYTMIGPGSSEIIVSEMPTVYKSMGNLERFVASLFSRTNASLEIAAVEWKLPFTFSLDECRSAPSCDVRTAGWGVLFSGIFLVSAAVILLALVRCRRSHPEVFRLSLTLSGMLAVSVLVIPGLSWARYFAALFLIPVAALLFLFAWWNRSGGRVRLVCAAAVILLLCANMAPNAAWSLLLVKNANHGWAQMAQLKELTQTQEVALGYSGGNRFEGRIFNVYDAGITRFRFERDLQGEDIATVFDRYPLYYRVEGK